jgi:hypothetical protein
VRLKSARGGVGLGAARGGATEDASVEARDGGAQVGFQLRE